MTVSPTREELMKGYDLSDISLSSIICYASLLYITTTILYIIYYHLTVFPSAKFVFTLFIVVQSLFFF